MNSETKNAIASRAAETILIVRTEQEINELKRAMRNVAAIAIEDTEYLDKQTIYYCQQRYLATLDEGAKKRALEKAFAAVFDDFCKEQEQKQ